MQDEDAPVEVTNVSQKIKFESNVLNEQNKNKKRNKRV